MVISGINNWSLKTENQLDDWNKAIMAFKKTICMFLKRIYRHKPDLDLNPQYSNLKIRKLIKVYFTNHKSLACSPLQCSPNKILLVSEHKRVLKTDKFQHCVVRITYSSSVLKAGKASKANFLIQCQSQRVKFRPLEAF